MGPLGAAAPKTQGLSCNENKEKYNIHLQQISLVCWWWKMDYIVICFWMVDFDIGMKLDLVVILVTDQLNAQILLMFIGPCIIFIVA